MLEKRERGEPTEVIVHKGSLQECMHGLVTYGIPSHFIPLNSVDGALNLNEHLRWIELRRRIESFPATHQASIVLVPCQEDVLLGKRKMSMNGNVLYHQTIMKLIKTFHETISEDERMDIVQQVRNAVNNRGGRFLMQIEDCGQMWEDLGMKAAIYFIRQAFDFLCMQLYAPTTPNSNGKSNGRSVNDECLFFGWGDIFDGKKCFSLVHHCKENKKHEPVCW